MRLKALAEIYTMHYFAQLLESIIEKWGKKDLAKTTPKRKKPLSNLKIFVKNC